MPRHSKKGEIMKWVAIALTSLLVVAPAAAASFDCAKAVTIVEHLICDNPELSKLDDEMAAKYKAGLNDSDPKRKDALRRAQKLWLTVRNTCVSADCVESAYKIRLEYFSHVTASTLGKNRYVADYERDPSPKTYLPAYVNTQDGEPFKQPRDPEVCSLYLQQLRYFARNAIPNSCGQFVAPGLAGHIAKVEWVNLDPRRYHALFEAIISKHYAAGKRKPTTSEFARAAHDIDSKEVVFRRMKLNLSGYPRLKYGTDVGRPEAAFNLVQYGPNTLDPTNPEKLFRCKLQEGRAISAGADMSTYIATADMAKLYWNSVDQLGGGPGQTYWLINDQLYAEWYDKDGTVTLSELHVKPQIYFEPVCRYHPSPRSKRRMEGP